MSRFQTALCVVVLALVPGSVLAQPSALEIALGNGISGIIKQHGFGEYDVVLQETDGVITAKYKSLGCEAQYTPIRVKSPNNIVYRAKITGGSCVGGNITLKAAGDTWLYQFRFPGKYDVIASGWLSSVPEREPSAPQPQSAPIASAQAPQSKPTPPQLPAKEEPASSPRGTEDTKTLVTEHSKAAKAAEQPAPPTQAQPDTASSDSGDASLIGQSTISQDYVPGEVLTGNYRLGHRIYLRGANFTKQKCENGLPITVRISSLLPVGHLDDPSYTGPFFTPTLRDLDWHCRNQSRTSLKSVNARYEFRGETVGNLTFVTKKKKDYTGRMVDVLAPAGFERLLEPAPFPETELDHVYDKAFRYMMECAYSKTCEVSLTFRELEQLALRGDPQAAYFLADPLADDIYSGKLSLDEQIFGRDKDHRIRWKRREALELSTISVEAYGDEDRLRRAADLGSLFANYGLARQLADKADLIDFDGYLTGRAPSSDLASLSEEDRHDFIVWFAKARYGGWLDAQRFADFDTLFANWGIDIAPVLNQLEQTGLLVPNSDISTDYAYSDALTRGVVRSALNALLVEECRAEGEIRKTYNDAMFSTGQALQSGNAGDTPTVAGQLGAFLTLGGAINNLIKIEPRGPFCFIGGKIGGTGAEVGLTINKINALECTEKSDTQVCKVSYNLRCVEHSWQQGTILPDIDLQCAIYNALKTQTTEFIAKPLGSGQWDIEGAVIFKNGFSKVQ